MGFPHVSNLDGDNEVVEKGSLGVSEHYDVYLEKLLSCQERLGSRPNMRRFELVKGDANITVPKYFEVHKETVVALAYFDIDLYEPTKKCLEVIAPLLSRGSVVAFDEACHPAYPSDTIAILESGLLKSASLKRCSYSGFTRYIVC